MRKLASQKVDDLLKFVLSLPVHNVNDNDKKYQFTYQLLKNTDLWTSPPSSSLCHCVARDLSMGAGIAVDFVNKFGSRNELQEQKAKVGQCAILKRNNRYIYYLITKPISKKPPKDYNGLIKSLKYMKNHSINNNVKTISMPMIGAGLDRLNWNKVEQIIKDIFKDTNININVYQYKSNTKQNKFINTSFTIIDGSIMEGGGQILRNSIALSALFNKPIHIKNIRGKRTVPGLRKQHSTGIMLIHKINGGYLEGNRVKSMEIKYIPKKKSVYVKNYFMDIKTAGSTCLLIQTALPLLLYSSLECSLTVIGGTNASFSPQIDYFELILKPTLKRLMNIDINIECVQRGFVPKGAGKVVLKTKPIVNGWIPSFNLMNRGNILKIYGRVIIGGRGLSLSIGNDVINGAINELNKLFNQNIDINITIEPKCNIDSYSNGIGVLIVIETDTGCLFGGSSLDADIKKPKRYKNKYGKRRKNKKNKYKNNDNNNDIDVDNNFEDYHEQIGKLAASRLYKDWSSSTRGCTDKWLQDQLIIFMALAKGRSKMNTSAMDLHTKTAIYIAELLTGAKFYTSTTNGGNILIECDGIGHNIPK